MKVGYIVSRFPKITETFILYEILAVEKQGVQVSLYPLLKPRSSHIHPEGASVWRKALERIGPPDGKVVVHPEAEDLVKRAHYTPFFSWPILKAQIHFLIKKPAHYLGALWTVIRANWGSWNYLLGGLTLFPKVVFISQQMVDEGVEHIHAHFANHPAAAAFIAHRLTGIPYSFTAHGADLQVDQHMLLEKVREARAVVTISNYNRALILANCGDRYHKKVQVIRCGIDTKVFSPQAAQYPAYRNGKPFQILCIGTMYEVKGHIYLIEACRLMKAHSIPFECHLIGDGPYRTSLTQQVIETGLVDQVHFHGQLTRPEVASYLRQADAVAVPSISTPSGRREGLPVVLMEAMGCERPVVASNISGIPELVEHGKSGLLVPPQQPQAIAEALQCLYENPELCIKMGQQGREKVMRDFDLNKNAAQLIRVFQGER